MPVPNRGKRQFKMGGSNPQLRGTGKMSEDRAAWLRTYLGQFTYMRYYKTADGEVNESGPNIVLYIPRPGARDLVYNLTVLTADELEKMEEFFQLMFDEARPIVAERDRVAREAFEAGDDSYARVYRQLPQFIIRSRSRFPDDESILDGPEDLPERDETDGSSDGDVRSACDSVAPEEPTAGSGQDAGETSH